MSSSDLDSFQRPAFVRSSRVKHFRFAFSFSASGSAEAVEMHHVLHPVVDVLQTNPSTHDVVEWHRRKTRWICICLLHRWLNWFCAKISFQWGFTSFDLLDCKIIYSFIRSYVHTFVHSFIQPVSRFIHWFNSLNSFIPSFINLFLHSFIRSSSIFQSYVYDTLLLSTRFSCQFS